MLLLGSLYKSEQFINCAAHFINPYTFTWFRARNRARARARVRARARARPNTTKIGALYHHLGSTYIGTIIILWVYTEYTISLLILLLCRCGLIVVPTTPGLWLSCPWLATCWILV